MITQPTARPINMIYKLIRSFVMPRILILSAVMLSTTLYAIEPSRPSPSTDNTIELFELIEIEQSAKQFAISHYQDKFPDFEIVATAAQLDSRSRITSCKQALQFDAPKILNRSGNNLISVRCGSAPSWRIFVPVNIAVIRDVVVAAAPIARGAPINASNTRVVRMNMAHFRDHYATTLEPIRGMISKRTFREGQAITVSHLSLPTLVKRGEAVVISAKTGITNVKIAGVAQRDGKKGEQIEVINPHSNRTIKATVIGKGRVKVLL